MPWLATGSRERALPAKDYLKRIATEFEIFKQSLRPMSGLDPMSSAEMNQVVDFGPPTNPSLLYRMALNYSDNETAREFLKTYEPIIRNYLRNMGAPREHMDDLFQNIFLKIISKLKEFKHRGVGTFRAWLKTVIRNIHHDFLSEIQSKQPLPLADAPLDRAAENLEREMDKAYYLELMTTAISRVRLEVNARTWEMFEMCHYQKRSAAVVAAHFGLAEKTVYSANFRILKRLRELCQKYDAHHGRVWRVG